MKVDRLRHAKTEGKRLACKIGGEEERERQESRIFVSVIIKVFGYYLEVTNSFKHLVPEYYTRKQTLANAERYIIPRLKELEDTSQAEDKLLCWNITVLPGERCHRTGSCEIQKLPKPWRNWIVWPPLRLWQKRNRYVRPKINEKGIINIKDGRHPVVEQMIPNDMFIANDTYLDDKKNQFLL